MSKIMSKLILTSEQQIEIEKAKEYLKAHGFVNPIMQTTNSCIVYDQRKDVYYANDGLLVGLFVNKDTKHDVRVMLRDFNKKAKSIFIVPAECFDAEYVGGIKL